MRHLAIGLSFETHIDNPFICKIPSLPSAGGSKATSPHWRLMAPETKLKLQYNLPSHHKGVQEEVQAQTDPSDFLSERICTRQRGTQSFQVDLRVRCKIQVMVLSSVFITAI